MHILVLFVSGILTGLPLIVPQTAILSWFSVIPLIYINLNSKYRHPFWNGLTWGAGYFGVLYYWFIYLYPLDFAGLNNVQSVAAIATAWIGLTLIQSAEFAFINFLFKKVNKNRVNIYSAFLTAFFWVIFEWGLAQTWTGVPWGRLAVSQYSVLSVIQSASLLGSLFVGFLIILINALLTLALINLTQKVKKYVSYAVTALIIFLLNMGFGFVSLGVYSDTSDAVRVALIQGNIGSADKWADGSSEYSLAKYLKLSGEAYESYKPLIISWPETVIPVVLSNREEYLRQIKKFSADTGVTLIVGAYEREYDSLNDENDTFNALYTFTPEESVIKPYYKRHLVPFGEYLPMPGVIKTFLPQIAELNVFDSDITPGTTPNSGETANGTIGYLICFDSIYDILTRESVREGAELIALSTNDSWYKDSAAVYQHNGHAVLRAVENSRYIMRAANTGVSTIIRADGKILASLAPLKEGIVYGEVHFRQNRTLYSYVGNIIVPIAAAYVCAVIIMNLIKKIKNKTRLRGENNDAEDKDTAR